MKKVLLLFFFSVSVFGVDEVLVSGCCSAWNKAHSHASLLPNGASVSLSAHAGRLGSCLEARGIGKRERHALLFFFFLARALSRHSTTATFSLFRDCLRAPHRMHAPPPTSPVAGSSWLFLALFCVLAQSSKSPLAASEEKRAIGALSCAGAAAMAEGKRRREEAMGCLL